jgi:hypothetical protein
MPESAREAGVATLDFEKALIEAITQAQPNLPSYVHLIQTAFGIDSAGDHAVWITVVLRDDTPPEERSFARLQQISQHLMRVVRDQPAGAFSSFEVTPYVGFVTEGELAEREA